MGGRDEEGGSQLLGPLLVISGYDSSRRNGIKELPLLCSPLGFVIVNQVMKRPVG